ncbi:MAG: hypothetical protein GX331_07705 [Firmicutes bacterium]|nr:hypothetical protein [Bacillota bacterium]
MVFSVGFEFETEETMLTVAEKLWTKYGVTGELEMYPTSNQKYRLNIHSEKQIKESILDKVPGKRMQAKISYGTSVPKESQNEDDD